MIRLVETSDEQTENAFLFEVYASTREEELKHWGWSESEQNAFLRMQFDMQRRSYKLQYPGLNVFVIWSGDYRAGRLMTVKSNDEHRVVDISLLGKFRNQGIGTQVLMEVCKQASENQLPVRLSVRNDNPARRLYERLGFVATSHDEMNTFMEKRPAGR